VAFALGLPVKGTLGVLLAAVLAGLLPLDQALNDLQRLLNQGIRISPRWQAWFRSEPGALQDAP
jgi:predicted nucleic acid-binding protein